MLSICIPSFSPYFYLLIDGFYVEKAANENRLPLSAIWELFAWFRRNDC
ncbi:hypothetical protein CUZ91_0885 [Enterococcus xinjiangensis]|nr:hypothetical protein [Enterococcus lactis]MBL4999831.1 hypothetical protein [Enterococcus lactis]